MKKFEAPLKRSLFYFIPKKSIYMTKKNIIKKWTETLKDEKWNVKYHRENHEPQCTRESKIRVEMIKEILEDLK